MKKKVLSRSLMGAPIGVCIATIVSLLISLIQNDGTFYAVVPEFVRDCGTELTAALVQTLCTLLYGAVWGGASVIWEMEGWSILRQTVTHLAVCCPATIAIAWFLCWMPHAAQGVALFLAIFFAIYIFIWLSQYLAIRRRIRQMNSNLENFRDRP